MQTFTVEIHGIELTIHRDDDGKFIIPDCWRGIGSALKPANEPICVGRKPLSEPTIALNILRWGTGAINIDGCRVETDDEAKPRVNQKPDEFFRNKKPVTQIPFQNGGRWPANIIHDGSDEVLAAFPAESSITGKRSDRSKATTVTSTQCLSDNHESQEHTDSGSPARFFYTAKADANDRIGSKHPTVKPVDLMQWLVRLVTPKGGLVLDPFAGTGTTGEAAFREGMRCILIERETEYQADIRRRMALCMAGPEERARESIKAKLGDKPIDAGPLFGGLDAPPRTGGESTGSSRTNDRTDRIEAVNE